MSLEQTHVGALRLNFSLSFVDFSFSFAEEQPALRAAMQAHTSFGQENPKDFMRIGQNLFRFHRKKYPL